MQNWHSRMIKNMKKRSIDELNFIIKDCREAVNAGGGFRHDTSKYADEMHYAIEELNRRGKK